MTELLAPAGSRQALVAAVQNGADAVYLGFGDFNARRSAHNFSGEDFRAAAAYCHLRGVRVYLTLNTLVTDRELPSVANAARVACENGVDAILVQDWGVLDTLRTVIPDVPLHASTQMSLHTLSGVREAARLGITRAVLARELSRSDIETICAQSPIELEVFAHGALCMCYSGQCEMSAVIGRRSGNRGMCAQPCRLPYGAQRADAHPLSLRDANLASHVPELLDLGVACIKLEGRMKRPEYVAAVTGIYARLLRERRAATADEQRLLATAFSRDGFTDGYFSGSTGPEMFGMRPQNARWPEDWFSELRVAYEKENLRMVPIRMEATIVKDKPLSLIASDEDGHSVRVKGAPPEAARTRSLTGEEVETRLRKTGGTAFTVEACDVTLDEGLMVSAASLNALRRDVLGQLEARRTAVPKRTVNSYISPETIPNPTAEPALTVSLAAPEQLTDALIAEQPARVYFPIEWLGHVDLTPYQGRTQFCAVLPRIYRTSDEDSLRALLLQARSLGVEAVTIGNLGHLGLVSDSDLEKIGDYSLNVFNSAALRFLRNRGLDAATVSFELRCQQIRDLQKCLPCEAIVYGRLPLMITENHPACEGELLTDRRDERFPLLSVYGGRTELQNAKTLFLADSDDYRRIGLSFARLRFTTETPADCVRVLRAYRGEDDFRPEDLTRGLFYRGVE